MVCDMKINCYAILDAKISDFHMAIFDIEHGGAMRQFSDAVNDEKTKWNRHPEDYSLWFVGTFDTTKGMLEGTIPQNLVNATAVMSLKQGPPQLDLFKNNDEKKEPVVN